VVKNKTNGLIHKKFSWQWRDFIFIAMADAFDANFTTRTVNLHWQGELILQKNL
jgi:hypothetical protein